MEKQFLDLFAACFDKDLDPLLGEAVLLCLEVEKEKREMVVTIRPNALLEKQMLFAAEQAIAQALSLSKCRIAVKYTPDRFTPDYLPQIAADLKRSVSVINGYFTDAAGTYENKTLTIHLKHGGLELLERCNVRGHVAALIEQEFSFRPEVRFDGVTVIDQDAYYAETPDIPFYEAVPLPNEAPPEMEAAPPFHYEESRTPAAKPREKRIKLDFSALPFPCSDAAVLIGRKIAEQPIPLSDVNAESGRVIVCGEVFDVDSRYNRDETKIIMSVSITDYTGSNILKIFADKKDEEKYAAIKKGIALLVRGDASYDKYEHEVTIRPFDIMTMKKEPRMDTAEEKRVELHLHTIMSAMDATTKIDQVINTAYRWGHKAVAITDHGVVQAFPDAMNAVDAIRKEGGEFKVIYGVEAYFVNDAVEIVNGVQDEPLDGEFVVFDTETTGLSAATERMTEIGAVRIRGGKVVDTFNTFVNPEKPIPPKITELTGITNEMVRDAPSEAEALSAFLDFCGTHILIAHNAPFDMAFIRAAARRSGLNREFTSLDTVPLCRNLLPELKKHKLNIVAEHLKLGEFNHHRACDDANMLAAIFLNLCEKLKNEKEVHTAQQINTACAGVDVKKAETFHQIILVKNAVGLKNLYKLISFSHLDYYFKRPRIPKSVLAKHREGLLIGSACEAGELYRAITAGKPWSELCEITKFYDYLEIQPIANNMFMLRKGMVESEEQLREYNRTIAVSYTHLTLPTT